MRIKKALALALALSLCAGPALARGDQRGRHGDQRGHYGKEFRGKHDGHGSRKWRGEQRRDHGDRRAHQAPRHHRGGYHHAPRHHRGYSGYYGGHGYRYRSHGHYDYRPFLWLGVAAAGLYVLHTLSTAQSSYHQQAYWGATRAPVGQTVAWSDADASGSWTPVDELTGPSGEYCREFQQEIVVGGSVERGYGTACYRPDGSWEFVR